MSIETWSLLQATKAGKGLLQITQQWLVFSLATHCFRLPGWRLAVTFTMENPSISPNQTSAKRSRIEVASVSRLASPCKQMAKTASSRAYSTSLATL